MTPILTGLLALLIQVHSFTYFAVGGFQFSPTIVTGITDGVCYQNCGIWGSNPTAVTAVFAAPVKNYRQTTSCADETCVLETTGDFDTNRSTVEVTVGRHTYYLEHAVLRGQFHDKTCLSGCRSHKHESGIALAFTGVLDNQALAQGTVQLVCLEKNGCIAGDGRGMLATTGAFEDVR